LRDRHGIVACWQLVFIPDTKKLQSLLRMPGHSLAEAVFGSAPPMSFQNAETVSSGDSYSISVLDDT